MRLTGVRRQRWHGDSAYVRTLQDMSLDTVPLSCLHPLSPVGSAILAVPLDVGQPVQVQVPANHVLLWRGDLEHCGDEWLQGDNVAFFANLDPAPSVFQAERDDDGAILTFPSTRTHSQVRLAQPMVVARAPVASAGSTAGQPPLLPVKNAC